MLDGVLGDGRGELRRAARAGDRARLARRDCRARPRPARLGPEAARGATAWTPEYFEFSFGLSDEGRDERSVPEPVTIDGRFILRGSVDVVESQRRLGGAAHHRSQDRPQPHDAADGHRRRRDAAAGDLRPGDREAARHGRCVGGRLFYCTAAGGFAEHPVPLSDANRRAGLEALEIIDRAIELGFLPPAPAERACTWCDFRPVCGPDEPRHLRRKPADSLADLTALRGMP